MRLEPEEILAIKSCALRAFGDGAKVILYGSRVDDSKRGGDIYLLIEADKAHATLDNELGFRAELAALIGERKIDVLLRTENDPATTIQDIAMSTGVRLL